MELGLLGNVVAVFGAASGIGAAIARAFAAEGARVVALDLDPGVMNAAGQPPGSIGLVADVCDYAAVKRSASKSRGNSAGASIWSMPSAPAQASLVFHSGISNRPTGSAC